MTRQDNALVADRLWSEYARTHSTLTRERLVSQFEKLAYSIANQFTRRGVDSEDLFQVARLGLVKAIDRFDPSTNYRFSTFAKPTIAGEIRRYFRDHSRDIRVPRGLKALAFQVQQAGSQLRDRLGRFPTSAELAEHLSLSEEQVVEALCVEAVQSTLSLHSEAAEEVGDSGPRLEDALGAEDCGFSQAEDRVGIEQAMSRLNASLQQIIRMRYLQEMSQREVAQQLGTSQMRVCRMEHRALDQLRTYFSVH